MSNTQTVREAIFKSYNVGATFTAPGLAMIIAGKITATQVGIALASIEKDNILPCIEKSGFVDQVGKRRLRTWKHLPKPAERKPAKPPISEVEPAKDKPKEPELDYAQIGKAIIERIQQLDTLANEGIEFRSVAAILEGRIVKLRAHEEEQTITIERLNNRISRLNEELQQAKLDKPKVDDGKTFKLEDIARIV